MASNPQAYPQGPQSLSSPHASQPPSSPQMPQEQQQKPQPSMFKEVGTAYAKSAASQAGKETVIYESAHGAQQFAGAKTEAQKKIDEAKSQARGLWQKIFGSCFGSS